LIFLYAGAKPWSGMAAPTHATQLLELSAIRTQNSQGVMSLQPSFNIPEHAESTQIVST